MKPLVLGLVEITFAVSFVAAVFGVAEWIAMLRFSRWAFRIGYVVMRETRSWPGVSEDEWDTALAASDEVREVEPGVYLFRSESRGLSVLDAYVIKGTLRREGSEVDIEGRVPFSTIAFVYSWVIGWTGTTLYMAMSGQDALRALGLALLGPLALIATHVFWIPMEVRRSRHIVDQFEHRLVRAGDGEPVDDPPMATN